MTECEGKTPNPPPLSEQIFGGRSPEEALNTPSKVRCAFTRLGMLTADGLIPEKRANAVAFSIAGAAKQNEIELAVELTRLLRELNEHPAPLLISESVDAVLDQMPAVNRAVSKVEASA